MKYGIYYFKNTHNIGDDIWAYAQSLFYPHIDYLIDNTTVYKFKSVDNEDVATIIGAFVEPRNYEYRFLPPLNIIPLFAGAYFRSTMWELLQNEEIRAYLKAFEPIGVRSFTHVDNFSQLGIKSFYSGCITLTLPVFIKKQQPIICLTDVPDFVADYIRNKVGNRFEIKRITHSLPELGEDIYLRHRTLSIDDRFEIVKEHIQIYANAHCVITSRLHCAIPCLTQNTPVLITLPRDGKFISDMETRINDSLNLFNSCWYEDFETGSVIYDFVNPPANPDKYLFYRADLIKLCNSFIGSCETGDIKNRFPYTEAQSQEYFIDILQQKVLQLKGIVDNKNLDLVKLGRENRNW